MFTIPKTILLIYLMKKKKFTILNFGLRGGVFCVKEIPDLLNIQSVQKEKFNVFFVSVGFTSPEDIKKV